MTIGAGDGRLLPGNPRGKAAITDAVQIPLQLQWGARPVYI